MQNPENVTRILFQAFPNWMLVIFWVAAIATILLFAYGCYIQIRKYRRGQPLSIHAITMRTSAEAADIATSDQ